MGELLVILLCIGFIVYIFKTRHRAETPNTPQRRQITRIEDIDGRIYYRGAPPEEWAALEEEYQRQEYENSRR